MLRFEGGRCGLQVIGSHPNCAGCLATIFGTLSDSGCTVGKRFWFTTVVYSSHLAMACSCIGSSSLLVQ